MNYVEIISKSLKIVWKNKFLWILGMLAALTEGGIGGGFDTSGFSPGNYQLDGPKNQIPNPSPSIEQSTKVLGASAEKFTQYLFSHPFLVLGIILCFFIILVIMVSISIIGRGGLIASVSKIENDEKTGFKKGLKDGAHFFWRILGQDLLLGLLISVILLAFASPVAALALFKIYFGAIALGLLFLPIFIILIIYLSVIRYYGIRAIILENVGVIEGLKKAHQKMMEHKTETLLIWLISIGLGFLIGFAVILSLFLIFSILGVPLFGLGFLIYKTLVPVALWIYISILVFLFGILF